MRVHVEELPPKSTKGTKEPHMRAVLASVVEAEDPFAFAKRKKARQLFF